MGYQPTAEDYDGSYYPTKFDLNKFRRSSIDQTATIKEIYPPVMREKPDELKAASSGWAALANHLSATFIEFDKHYRRLEPEWTGEASAVFFNWIEATMRSLTEWKTVAAANAAALLSLADCIQQLQAHMTELWKEFSQEIAAAAAQDARQDLPDLSGKYTLEFAPDEIFRDLVDLVSGQSRLDPILEKYTYRTIDEVLDPLNSAFRDAYLSTAPGRRFAGPTNAQEPTQQQLNDAFGAGPITIDVPSMPIPPGGLSGIPPTIPPPITMPQPRLPALPGMPGSQLGLPPGLNLSEDTAAFPPAFFDAIPAMESESGLAGATLPPGLTALAGTALGEFGSSRLPSSGESLANLGQRGLGGVRALDTPEMPRGLQGRAATSMLGDFDEPPVGLGRRPPQATGRGRGATGSKSLLRPGLAQDEMPEMIPPGRRLPNLVGRKDRKSGHLDEADPLRSGASGDVELPGLSRFGTHGSLQGIRTTKSGVKSGVLAVEDPATEQVRTLTGRLGVTTEMAEEELESALQALRVGLSGRRPTAVGTTKSQLIETAAKPGASEDANLVAEFVGDSGLFVPDPPAPAVIERPQEPQLELRREPALRPGPGEFSVA